MQTCVFNAMADHAVHHVKAYVHLNITTQANFLSSALTHTHTHTLKLKEILIHFKHVCCTHACVYIEDGITATQHYWL